MAWDPAFRAPLRKISQIPFIILRHGHINAAGVLDTVRGHFFEKFVFFLAFPR
jgi:hypothetical protein